MFFTIDEIVLWMKLTVFEIWIHLVSLTIFSVLLTLKIDNVLYDTSWWVVFSPLFACDALNTYCIIIVFIRIQLENSFKVAFIRGSWSLLVLSLLFLFKVLLCKKLTGENNAEYSEIFAPLFILLQLMAIKACQLSQ